MKPILTTSMVPVSDFKASPAKYLKSLVDGPVVITTDGRAAGIVLLPGDYDLLVKWAGIGKGLADADEGKPSSPDEVRERLSRKRPRRRVAAR